MKKVVKLEELSKFVEEFLNSLGDPSTSLWTSQNVFGLFGNLGTGKTTFVKELAKQLGIKEEVNSPTFTIMQSYEISYKPTADSRQLKKLVHIDLYRIEDGSELEVLKLNELFEDKENLILIEWADKLELSSDSRQPTTKIFFEYNDENSRIIEIKNGK
jgi:tRNA threonylcarbamoyladenosine biosynthesis protein TsaE